MEQPCSLRPFLPPASRAQPYFDKLATETIEAIFSAAYPYIEIPDLSTSNDPSKLSQVCKRWNAITKSHHALWATLSICCSTSYGISWTPSDSKRLHDYLNRSGVHPLEIYMAGADNLMPGRFFGILSIVGAHSHRWQSFSLNVELEYDLLYAFNGFKGHLPLLEELDMTVRNPPCPMRTARPCTAFCTAPLLSRLQLGNVADRKILRYLHMPWTQITEFTFSNGSDFRPDRQDLREILQAFQPSLRTLTFQYFMHPATDWAPSSADGKPVALVGLRRLKFVNTSIGILNMLVCPSLQELDTGRGHPQEIAIFLHNSSCSLTHFRLNCGLWPRDTDGTTVAVLQNPSLSTLKHASLHYLRDWAALNLFIFDSRNLFPLLETLEVELTFIKDKHDAQLLSSTVETLHKITKSRTQPRHPPASTTIDAVSEGISDVGRSSAASALQSLNVTVGLGGEKKDYTCEENLLQEFQSFCESRNMRITLTSSRFDLDEDFVPTPLTEEYWT